MLSRAHHRGLSDDDRVPRCRSGRLCQYFERTKASDDRCELQTVLSHLTIGNTDTSARIAFDMAQSTRSVQLDDIGIYEGDSCGTP
ncbi:MAG: hypothetical protein Ct9H300mP8_00940 [Gammaproteobacteria bacterium]|nr:MAG: hypothetical protein Ct9H300mP8_00940 [Gammaproteobacteria bacterium]